MKLIHDPHEIYAQIEHERRHSKRIGVVPTMGALHQGHLSLVERAKQECDLSVATIFVNPTQFGPNEDLSRYPRTLESDLVLLQKSNCDYVFVPTANQIYRDGHSTYVDPPAVAKQWEGVIRPVHFRGVATIVLKLFQMIPAHVAYFGTKDYQQVAVLRGMVEDLNIPVRIEACPTIREADGLAMSSRNRYLSSDERGRALGLWRCLTAAQKKLDEGCHATSELEASMIEILERAPVDSIDYAAVVHPDSMERIDRVEECAVAIVAARVGGTRLIDNLMLVAPKQLGEDS
ncbi:MAG: pantoate--beta-alanine ligase [Pirellula sp.]